MDAMNKAEKWKTIPSMKNPRSGFGATAIGEKIYVAGGHNEQNRFLSFTEVYDTKSNE